MFVSITSVLILRHIFFSSEQAMALEEITTQLISQIAPKKIATIMKEVFVPNLKMA